MITSFGSLAKTAACTAGLLALLSACAQPPSSITAGPASAPANPATAGQIFGRACLQNLPSFSGTIAALASEPVTERQGSGIYYHDTQNLSVKLLQSSDARACQLVFGTNVARAQAVQAFGTAASAAAPGVEADLSLDVGRGADGLLYFTATTQSR